MKTEDIIDLMRGNERFAYAFMGAEKPKATELDVAGDEYEPTSRLMLMLLEREYGLTETKEKCQCLNQFASVAAYSFGKWLKSTQPQNEKIEYWNKNTIDSVKKLLDTLLYGAPPEPTGYLVAGGIIFRYVDEKIMWSPYIDHYAKQPKFRDLWYWTETGEQYEMKNAKLVTITANKKVRGVVTQLFVSFLQLSPSVNRKLILHIADREIKTPARYKITDAPHLPALFVSRYDEASFMTSYENGNLSFWSDANTRVSFRVRNTSLNYIDYESFAVVLEDEKMFRVLIGYRWVPKDANPKMITIDFSRFKPPEHEFLGFLRLDRKTSKQKFVLAIVFRREKDTEVRLSFHVVRAREDESLYYSGQFDVSGPRVRLFDIPEFNQAARNFTVSDTEIKFSIQRKLGRTIDRDDTTINIDSENVVTKRYSFEGVEPSRIFRWYEDAFQPLSAKLESIEYSN